MHLALIGGGLGATALYIELASKIGARLSSVTIFDAKGVLNSLSFHTESDVLLANTSAGLTSVVNNNPMDFLAWVRERYPDLQATPESFLPRRLVRQYALSRFASAKEYLASLSCPTELVSQEVMDVHGLSSGSFRVMTKNRTTGPYDAVVLATGPVFQQPFPDLLTEPGYIGNPYPESVLLKGVKEGTQVLVLGARLTAIDAALTILAYTEKTKIFIASSSGVLPAVRSQLLAHSAGAFDAHRLVQDRPRSLLRSAEMAALSDLRRLSATRKPARKYPSDAFERLMYDIEHCETGQAQWQRAIVPFADGINDLWPHLSFDEQRKLSTKHHTFLSRFLSAFPIENGKKLATAMKAGRLVVRKIPRTPPFDLTTAGKFEGTGPLAGLVFDTVINATGLAPSGFRDQALYRNLLSRRNLLNAHGGLAVDVRTMRLTGAGLNTMIYALGSPTTGSEFFTSYLRGTVAQASRAVADIGQAVERLAS